MITLLLYETMTNPLWQMSNFRAAASFQGDGHDPIWVLTCMFRTGKVVLAPDVLARVFNKPITTPEMFRDAWLLHADTKNVTRDLVQNLLFDTNSVPPVTSALFTNFTVPFLDTLYESRNLVHGMNNHLIVGESGSGKTQFALAHFERPLLISALDDLKGLQSHHTGLVFDDIDLKAELTPTQIIHLLDRD